MSDEACSRITITNIQDSEILYYPLVLLKGIIEHDDNCNESSKARLLTSTTTNATTTPKNDTKAPKTNFKILIELKSGENIVKVDFCCSSLNMKLTYNKRKSPCTVVPMFIINKGHSGKFQAPDIENNSPESACKRILTGCKLLQCLIAEKLYEEGLGRKTFQLENNECVIFHSNLNYKIARSMGQEQLWAHLGREIMNSKIGSENKKYLGFIACTKYNGETKLIQSYEDMIKVTEGHIALGGGGLALFGSACLFTWPQHIDEVINRFEDETIVDKRKFMDDSCYRGTYGTCFTTTLGSVLHELCHTFDLGHSQEGIMDRGFDNIHKFFTIGKHRLILDKERNFEDIKTKFIQASLNINAAMNSNGIIRNPKCVQENVIRNKSNDDTYFTRSCSFLLFYHKYFNDYPSNDKFLLMFDASTKFVKSTVGVRVIEVRREQNEVVDYSWTFPGKILKYSFQIPEDCFSNKVLIVVEDNVGNILKEYYKI